MNARPGQVCQKGYARLGLVERLRLDVAAGLLYRTATLEQTVMVWQSVMPVKRFLMFQGRCPNQSILVFLTLFRTNFSFSHSVPHTCSTHTHTHTHTLPHTHTHSLTHTHSPSRTRSTSHTPERKTKMEIHVLTYASLPHSLAYLQSVSTVDQTQQTVSLYSICFMVLSCVYVGMCADKVYSMSFAFIPL